MVVLSTAFISGKARRQPPHSIRPIGWQWRLGAGGRLRSARNGKRRWLLKAPSGDSWPEKQHLAASPPAPSSTEVMERTMECIARCHCGALQATVRGQPEWVNVCRCRACQRRTGSVLHTGAYFRCTQVDIGGVSKIFARGADSGYEIHSISARSAVRTFTGRPLAFRTTTASLSAPSPTRPFLCRPSRFGRPPCTRGFRWLRRSNGSPKAASASPWVLCRQTTLVGDLAGRLTLGQAITSPSRCGAATGRDKPVKP